MASALKRYRAILMALGVIALLFAMWAGLVRMGWRLPPLERSLAGRHGPLMVAGFLGTVISLERAVALKLPWTYLAPVLAALGGVALFTGAPALMGEALITLASVVLVAVFGLIVRRQRALFTEAMAAAAALWVGGNVLWLTGSSIPQAVPWWAGFLILTIFGERLELSRLTVSGRTAESLFLAATGIYVAGLLVTLLDYGWGVRLAGLGLVGMSAWLLRFDVARRTVHLQGLPRFIAVALLTGYVWLGISGLLAIWYGGVMAGAHYDAILHAVFLGFTMSMIFAHAPVIFPAVMGRALPYRPVFYTHLALLHLSLALRVAGDLTDWLAGRQWGGMLNVFALLFFLFNTAAAVRGARSAAA
ncbi:MAG: hypothetical protein ACM3ZA_04890 [Bacillota bacterium]